MTATLPPPLLTPRPPRHQAQTEAALLLADPTRFAHHYCRIYCPPGPGNPSGDWIPFRLWPAQKNALRLLPGWRLALWLKARQLGMTWLALAYSLHTLLFQPGSTVLLFSRRDDEAIDLLQRLKGMHARLPEWLRMPEAGGDLHEWRLPSGSRCLAFPTTAGDSYTASLAVVDEADLVPDLDRLMGSVKPTIDAGGKLLLLSRPDKSKPLSPFKRIARAALANEGPWRCLFLPWHARPDRDAAWYERQKADSLTRTGSLDSLWEQYPGTPEEALAARTLDKRIPLPWLQRCYKPLPPLTLEQLREAGAPAVPGLLVWKPPEKGQKCVVGGDPAQGNPTSDDSAACVLDAKTGEQLAAFAGKHDPVVFASYIDKVGCWYNHSCYMVERNNHGHAVIAWLRDNSKLRCLKGHDKNPGWLSSTTGKVLLYDGCADAVREGEVLIRDPKTFQQLCDLEGNTLRAPEGMMDDAADSCAFAIAGRPMAAREGWKMEAL